MKTKQEWQLYDPHTGGRLFELRGRDVVSTANYDTWVLEGMSSSWESSSHLLDAAFRRYHGDGYFTYLPWVPGARRSVQTLKEIFPDVVDLDNLLCATRLETVGLVERIFGVVGALGGRASGLWSFGVTTSPDDLVRRLILAGVDAESPIFATAAALPVVQAALCLDDGVDMLFLRETPNVAAVLNEIATNLSGNVA